MEPQELTPSRWPGMITTTALLAAVVGAIVLYRSWDGWHSHEQPSGSPPAFRLNPNTAPWEELACLPDLGPVVAKRIVEHREASEAAGTSRPFRSETDLDKVPGIGPRTLEEIRPYLVYE